MSNFFSLIRSFSAPNVFNPWTDTNPEFDLPGQGPLTRYARLQAHFDVQPSLLMIGEAVGFQGAAKSGIAFTSERLIVEGGIPRVSTSGQRITSRRLPFSEPSATIVWGALHQHGLAQRTVLWNAFAWHPHMPGNLQTNRTPTKTELDAGKAVLEEFVRMFSGVPIIAVGRTSEGLLGKLGIKVDGCVNHPAMGGATKYRRGIAEWAERTGATLEPSELQLTG